MCRPAPGPMLARGRPLPIGSRSGTSAPCAGRPFPREHRRRRSPPASRARTGAGPMERWINRAGGGGAFRSPSAMGVAAPPGGVAGPAAARWSPRTRRSRVGRGREPDRSAPGRQPARLHLDRGDLIRDPVRRPGRWVERRLDNGGHRDSLPDVGRPHRVPPGVHRRHHAPAADPGLRRVRSRAGRPRGRAAAGARRAFAVDRRRPRSRSCSSSRGSSHETEVCVANVAAWPRPAVA